MCVCMYIYIVFSLRASERERVRKAEGKRAGKELFARMSSFVVLIRALVNTRARAHLEVVVAVSLFLR
jgi:hypothetical protein